MAVVVLHEHPTHTPQDGKRWLNSPRPCSREWVSSVRVLKEPLFAVAFVIPLTLDGILAEEVAEVSDEVTEELLFQAQQEMFEVGDIGVVDGGVCVAQREGAIWRCDVAESVEQVAHVHGDLLKLFDSEVLDLEVTFAFEKEVVVGSKRR